MRKYIALVAATLGLAALTAGSAFGGQPANPGCFGQDRAAYAQEFGSLGHEFGGVGYWASERAGDNGDINQAYMISCGGLPTN